MVNKSKFIEQLRSNPKNIKYNDICNYLDSFASKGLRAKQKATSHRTYKKKGFLGVINIQPDKKNPKMCKDYQVKQVVYIFRRFWTIKRGKQT